MSAPRTDTTLIDASPGQLYITASGHLYHAGKICIVMAGLPARGKTARTVSVARYLRWLGVRVQKFHLSNYRRELLGAESELPKDYYSFTAGVREQLLLKVTQDIWQFFADGGQVALYDAINPLATERLRLAQMCKERGVECLFVECSVTDEYILARNIAEINRASPDYAPLKDKSEVIERHIAKLKQTYAYYEPLNENELIYIKIQNDGEKIMVNHGPLGYLLNRVLLFNLNSRKRHGSLFFARAGATAPNSNEDDDLCAGGQQYSQVLFETLVQYMSSVHYVHHDHSGLDPSQLRQFADIHSRAVTPEAAELDDVNLTVLTSSRVKAIQTSRPFKAAGFPTHSYSLMTQRKVGHTTEEHMADWKKDPYHYSFPRGESFQDVAIRLEPVLLELERIETSVLIIAHESVLAVLFGYFKGLSTTEIPNLRFSGDEIIELSSNGYEHLVKTIAIPGAQPNSTA